jgi:hypothetical protein
MTEAVIPYYPRPIWRDEIHPALEKKKRAVLVCHRRFGKTIGCVNELIKKALQNVKLMPKYAYVAPFRNQAKRIAWEWLKYYTSTLPGRTINESDLYVELPTMHPGSPGARIQIVGADYPDNLRGDYLDGVVLDEFAQIKKELYGEIIVPMLADRDGFSYIVGTPKGQNHFYEKYLQALKDPDEWFSCLHRVDETGILPPEKVEEMKKEMTPDQIRQELLCDFAASASNVVIPIDLVTESVARHIAPDAVQGMPAILAVDVARFGDDTSVLTYRQGLFMDKPKRAQKMNTMELASFVASEYWNRKPDALVIDGGAMGPGVIDRLRQMGISAMEINFQQRAQDPQRYANIRAEMYFKMLEWMQQGGALPDDQDLKAELTVTEYRFTSNGRIILQPKEEIKELTGRSPDAADSAALTFAVPIHKHLEGGRKTVTRANTEYKIF